MHAKKTGASFARPPVGAVSARRRSADRRDRRAAAEFGLAFQIVDDILA
jgi:geranylgeranyl pyrophosphate synthase